MAILARAVKCCASGLLIWSQVHMFYVSRCLYVFSSPPIILFIVINPVLPLAVLPLAGKTLQLLKSGTLRIPKKPYKTGVRERETSTLLSLSKLVEWCSIVYILNYKYHITNYRLFGSVCNF
jgi:hypothetical protein